MRTAVTLLDAYRYWRDNEYRDAGMEADRLVELIKRIRGERTPQTDAMLRGIAFHDVCEHAHDRWSAPDDGYLSSGYVFEGQSMGMVLMDLPPDRVCEVKMTERIGDTLLVGKADYINGLDIGDAKLAKRIDHDKYFESVQWKAYLRMADCERFTYHVAQPRVDRKSGVIKLANYTPFTFYRSAETDREVENLCADFQQFAQPYLGNSPDA